MYQYFIPFYGQMILDDMAVSTFCLSICQLINIWVVSPFWLLQILLLWTLMYKFLYGCILISLGYISRCRISGSFITLPLTLWGTGFYSKVWVYYKSHQQCSRVPVSPTLVVVCFIFDILLGVQWYHPVVLVCISLMTNDTEHHFTCSLAICLSALEKYLFRSFALFLI